MKTGTPILDNPIYLRLGVPFIALIDFKPGICFLWVSRAIVTLPEAPGDTIEVRRVFTINRVNRGGLNNTYLPRLVSRYNPIESRPAFFPTNLP